MEQAASKQQQVFGDRIQWMSVLIVLCFLSVLLLRSQSAASYPTYALSLFMLATFPKWRDVLRLHLIRLIFALLVWLCLSVFWSDPFEWRAAISVWTRALLVFFFVVAMAECQLRGQLQRWMGVTLTVAGAGVVLVALVNFFTTDPADGRLNGLGQLDTHVVAALVYGVILLFVLRTATMFDSRTIKGAAILVALVIAYAVYLSDSRNAWVSVTLGVVAYGLAYRAVDWRQFLVTLVGMGILMGILVVALAFGDATAQMVLPRGSSFRPEIWGETLRLILDNDALLIGRGILTSDDVMAGGILMPHAHNIYLALVHQGGLVALGLYVVVLVSAIISMFRNFDLADARLGVSILIVATFSHLLDGHELIDKVGDTWLLVWMPVGLALGMSWTPGRGRGL